MVMECILTLGHKSHSVCVTDRLGKSVLLNLISLYVPLGQMICIVNQITHSGLSHDAVSICLVAV